MQGTSQERAELELTLPAEAASIPAARQAVAELAATMGAPVRDVKLAVSEAVTNCVVHAFRGGSEGTIRITARVQDGRLLVAIADDGTGMKPNLESPGLGVGISLITTVANDVRFDSSPAGLTVSMAFEPEEET
jgi:anti-sigma regulatory factor (Ser/Thr protein kinase)